MVIFYRKKMKKYNEIQFKKKKNLNNYIMYNPVIVIGTKYFVLWNDFHITV